MIDLPEDEPSIITRILTFLYTSNYPTRSINTGLLGHMQFKDAGDEFGTSSDDGSPVIWQKTTALHTRMYAAGKKLGFTDLLRSASKKFIAAFMTFGGAKSDLTSEDEAKLYQQQLSKIIRFVYDTTPPTDRVLRDIIVLFVQIAIDTKLDGFQTMLTLVRILPDFAIDLATRRSSTAMWSCTDCGARCNVLVAPVRLWRLEEVSISGLYRQLQGGILLFSLL